MREDDLEPWLGAIGKEGLLFSRLKARSSRLGWQPGLSGPKGIKGRDMRGGGVSSVLMAHQQGRVFHRRARVFQRIVMLNGTGKQKILGHLRYLSRDGKGRAGEAPELYSDKIENTRDREFSEASASHRHQFRLAVEPDNSWEYDDLRPFVHKLMKQVASDLRVDLDWVAADHFDNGKPHAHIVMAGRDRQGDDILIAPHYLRHGLPIRATELVSLDLGPKAPGIEPDIDVTAERTIGLDYDLLARADRHGVVRPLDDDGEQQGRLTRRLLTLCTLGLAAREAEGRWRLREDMLLQLAAIETRNGAWSALQSEARDLCPARPASDYGLWDPARDDPATGRVLAANLLPDGDTEIILDTVRGELIRARGRCGVSLRSDMIIRLAGSTDARGGEWLERGLSFEVAVLSDRTLEQLVDAGDHNWLDEVQALGDAMWLGQGFGKEVRAALFERGIRMRGHTINEMIRERSIDLDGASHRGRNI